MSYSAPSATTRMSASYEPPSVVTRRAAGSIAVMRSWRNSTAGFASSRYGIRRSAASAPPKRMSSFEKPKVKASFWSISVTRAASGTESESLLASSNPPNPAPRIRTCFMPSTLRSSRGALGSMAPMARTGEAAGALQRGRDAYAARAWADAYALLRRADESEALAPPDLGLLATAAFMLGRDEDWVVAHERAHYLHLEAGEVEPAARCA